MIYIFIIPYIRLTIRCRFDFGRVSELDQILWGNSEDKKLTLNICTTGNSGFWKSSEYF